MILVTGGTGLVGGHLLWHLVQDNDKVIALKRASGKTGNLEKIFRFYTKHSDEYLSRIEWRTADISNRESINAIMDDITEVYHCAAVVSLGSNPGNIEQINVTGTKNMVDASLAAGIRKFCFVSSIAACGNNHDETPVNESVVWEDNETRSPYSRSKFFSEKEVWAAGNKGLNIVIVNPGVILGYSGIESGSSRLFSLVRKGLPFYIDGGSGYVDVQDVVMAMILLMKSDISGERYILTEGNYTNKQILGWIAKGFGRKFPLVKINKLWINIAGNVMESLGKLFGFNPLLDKKTALSVTNRGFYTSEKFKIKFSYVFRSVETTIEEICRFISVKE